MLLIYRQTKSLGSRGSVLFLLKQNGATMNRTVAEWVAQFCLRRKKKEKLRNYGTNFTNVNLTAVLIHVSFVTVT